MIEINKEAEMRHDVDILARQKKLLYRAEHRGTKELDYLLGTFARDKVFDMSEADLEQFEKFMVLPEPEIERMILTGDSSRHGDCCDIVSSLRRYHQLEERGK